MSPIVLYYIPFGIFILTILFLFYKGGRKIKNNYGLLFFILGLLLTFGGIYLLSSSIYYVVFGNKTWGEIINYEMSYTTNEDNSQNTLFSPIFSYLDQDNIEHSFKSKIQFESTEDISLGTKKKIYYLEGVKNSGFYNSFSHWFGSLLAILIGGITLYILYVFTPTQVEKDLKAKKINTKNRSFL
ncbi:hypothetical protein [Aquimarina muelleri]|uniref:DUF3592 domain-containing protein n=1 Tax=Aquimarina muelleri TaxID=279356 RepID=A0A918N3E8_9FLAO|nr:hypothetical protein [Aquimarina muelleri]MCX2764615.1 hypothetical protein [Aquimarina muelleri]GGX19226.1 hypothetical protein GCM10007384_20710 [Aquimarina muelleri]